MAEQISLSPPNLFLVSEDANEFFLEGNLYCVYNFKSEDEMLKPVTIKMRTLASTLLMVLFMTLCKVMVQSFESDLRLAIQLKAI